MSKLGVLVVGPGWVAGEHIKAYAANPHTEIRAMAGMVPEDRQRAETYAEQYELNAEYTDDYEGALERDDIDVVAVCTINFLHYRQGLAAVRAGKHTFVEKPLCFSLDEARHLVDAAGEKGVTTMVGHVGRFYPAISNLHRFVADGYIGDVFYAESDYWHEIVGAWKVKRKTGGSALLMGGCHSVDMVRWMMGEDRAVSEVSAYSTPARRRHDFEYHPNITLMMRFADGAVGKVACSIECNMPYVFHLHVNGTEGAVRNNGLFSAKMAGMRDFMSLPATYLDDWNVSHHPFPEEVDYFVDCIRAEREPTLSFRRACKTYEVIFAAEKAAEEGRPVALPF